MAENKRSHKFNQLNYCTALVPLVNKEHVNKILPCYAIIFVAKGGPDADHIYFEVEKPAEPATTVMLTSENVYSEVDLQNTGKFDLVASQGRPAAENAYSEIQLDRQVATTEYKSKSRVQSSIDVELSHADRNGKQAK